MGLTDFLAIDDDSLSHHVGGQEGDKTPDQEASVELHRVGRMKQPKGMLVCGVQKKVGSDS